MSLESRIELGRTISEDTYLQALAARTEADFTNLARKVSLQHGRERCPMPSGGQPLPAKHVTPRDDFGHYRLERAVKDGEQVLVEYSYTHSDDPTFKEFGLTAFPLPKSFSSAELGVTSPRAGPFAWALGPQDAWVVET
jgi:hypothetical protein